MEMVENIIYLQLTVTPRTCMSFNEPIVVYSVMPLCFGYMTLSKEYDWA